jgi:hypothetical protein
VNCCSQYLVFDGWVYPILARGFGALRQSFLKVTNHAGVALFPRRFQSCRAEPAGHDLIMPSPTTARLGQGNLGYSRRAKNTRATPAAA